MSHSSYHSVLTLGYPASGAIAAKRFVTHARAQAGAGVAVWGVSEYEAADGEDCAVVVLGTAIVETGAAINGSVRGVESDAQGRAIPRNTGKLAGFLAPDQTATAAGQFVEILVIQSL